MQARRIAVLAAMVLTLAAFTPQAFALGNATDGANAGPGVDAQYALVQLRGDPLSTAATTRPAKGKKIDFDGTAVRSVRAQLSALRNDFKQWLRANAPAAKVTGEFDVSLNAIALKLNGESLATIAAAPQVLRAEYQGIYRPVTMADPDLALIQATAAWAAGGDPARAGEGVKVAIVDSGIDATHPCFDSTGYPPQARLGDPRFTNDKVIAAKVFNNKTPSRGYTAEAIDSHGTHVAGTVACNAGTAATVDGVAIPHPIAGVAPRALLGNYNVFPDDTASARSEDILNALEAAYADGFDVANMSLGGGASGIQDLLTIAVDDLDEANMVVAVAAGNSGPGLFTVESPGSAARALTAGAATVGHFIAAPVTVVAEVPISFPGVRGDFGTVDADLTALLATVAGTGANGLSTACSAFPAASLSGKIALVARGTCTFSTKVRNAQSAGAVGVVVSNNTVGDAITMGQDGTPAQPTLPAFMLSMSNAGTLKTFDGTSATLGAGLAYFVTGNDDFMASFSSQGPTDVDFRVKPDAVAPGVNVLSSIPHQFCAAPPCFAFFQGTSMATPHLAGSAAVVRWAHPAWSASQVRSAIVNTALRVLRKSSNGTPELNVNVIGAGREDLLLAVGAPVALDPVSVSFGAVPSGSGQTRTFDVQLTDLGGAGGTYAVAVGAGGGGVAYSVSPAQVTLGPGESATVTVTMSADKGALTGGHQATLSVSAASAVAHAAVYTLVK